MTVASIDIGTNTVLLLIAEVDLVTKKIISLHDEQRIPRIGKGLLPGGMITEDRILLLYESLLEYKKTIDHSKCEQVIVTATNAFRIASNKDKLINEIAEKFGFDVQVISGEQEGKFAYLGAISEFNEKENILVIDIGGGSTELIFGYGKEIIYDKSYPIGVVSGTEKYLISNPPTEKEISHFNEKLFEIFDNLNTKIDDPDTSIAIAGTPTTLACIKQGLKEYNENVVEGSSLTMSDLTDLILELSQLSSKEIKKKYDKVVSGREDVLLAGTIILKHILQSLDLIEVKVSTKGIRYGAIINHLLRTD